MYACAETLQAHSCQTQAPYVSCLTPQKPGQGDIALLMMAKGKGISYAEAALEQVRWRRTEREGLRTLSELCTHAPLAVVLPSLPAGTAPARADRAHTAAATGLNNSQRNWQEPSIFCLLSVNAISAKHPFAMTHTHSTRSQNRRLIQRALYGSPQQSISCWQAQRASFLRICECMCI